MAKIEKLDPKKTKDKLTAHLAMAAQEQSTVEGPCLSYDELADMAAGLCSAEEKKIAISHFSSCQRCYDAWIAVSFSLVSANTTTKKTRRLITFRSLTYLGSAFAVAASVVVFFNISGIPLVQQQEVMEENRKSSARSAPALAPQALDILQDSVKEELTTTRQKSNQQAPPTTAAEPKRKVGAADVTSTDSAQGLQNANVPTETAASVAAAEFSDNEAVDVSIKSWLEQLQIGCLEQAEDTEFWQKIVKQGRILVTRTSAAKEKALLQDIMEQLEQSDASSDNQSKCRAIEALLAKPGMKE